MTVAPQFDVVVNDEGQYSVWPASAPPPPGWHLEGTRADREACLDHIAEIWTDLRPASVRTWLDEHGR